MRPGSVTPFAAINDAARRVTVVLQRAMLAHDPLNYHPLENTRTTAIAPADLVRFLEACGHQPRIVDIAGRDEAAERGRSAGADIGDACHRGARAAMLWADPTARRKCRMNL